MKIYFKRFKVEDIMFWIRLYTAKTQQTTINTIFTNSRPLQKIVYIF